MRLAAVGIAAACRLAEQFPAAETAVVESAAVEIAVAESPVEVGRILAVAERIVVVAERIVAEAERISVEALSVADGLALELFGYWFAEPSDYSAGLSSREGAVEKSDCFLGPKPPRLSLLKEKPQPPQETFF